MECKGGRKMDFAFNHVTDNQYLLQPYTWRKYEIIPTQVKKSQLKYEFINIGKLSSITTTKKHIAKLTNGKEKTIYLTFNPICTECLILYKNGNKEFSQWNHFYKNDLVTLKGLPLSKVKTSKIEKIILFDDFKHHENLRKYWNEKGFSHTKAIEEIKIIKNNMLNEY